MSFMKFSKGKPIYSVPNGIGDGAYFDGASGTRLDSTLPLPYGNDPRSVSFWIYYIGTSGNTSGWQYMIAWGVFGTSQLYAVALTGNKLALGCFNSNYESSIEVTKNTWHHVVYTYDGNNNHQMYLDGQPKASFTLNTLNTQQGEITLGYNSQYGEYFNGNLKDYKIYNRALTQEEVETLYNKGKVTDGLVLNIPLTYGKDDDSMFTSKNFVYDYAIIETSSGFDDWGYPIRYDMASECGINYATIPTDNLILYMALKENRTTPEVVDSDVFTTSYEGNYNRANYQVVDNVPCLYLASSTAIGLATKANGNIRQATLSYWGKLTDVGSCFITNSLNGNPSTWGSGSPEIWLGFTKSSVNFSNGNDQEEVIRTKKDVDKNWHHVAVTWDMDTNYMYLYFDGELVGERTDKKWLSPNFNVADYRFYINDLYRASGNGTGNTYYSSVRMYDRVLKASEIKALAKEF